MQYNINLDEVALTVGISTDKLEKSISTYSAMSEIFPALETAGIKTGLFGGTALNKIYFGKSQRLSYDLDIFAYTYAKTIKELERMGAKPVFEGNFPKKKGIKSTRMTYKGIVLDIVDAKSLKEQPTKLQAFDLLYYYGQLISPTTVPSYKLEYLLAEKTMAMLDRNELKDIYDMYTGIRLLKDIKTYQKNLMAAAKRQEIKDILAYADVQMHVMLKNSGYYRNKKIEVTDKATAPEMLREIKRFMDTRLHA